jgi:hypothetical protein
MEPAALGCRRRHAPVWSGRRRICQPARKPRRTASRCPTSVKAPPSSNGTTTTRIANGTRKRRARHGQGERERAADGVRAVARAHITGHGDRAAQPAAADARQQQPAHEATRHSVGTGRTPRAVAATPPQHLGHPQEQQQRDHRTHARPLVEHEGAGDQRPDPVVLQVDHVGGVGEDDLTPGSALTAWLRMTSMMMTVSTYSGASRTRARNDRQTFVLAVQPAAA